MSLRSKAMCILVAVFTLYGGLNYAVQRLVIHPGFAAVERNEARMDASRCMEALRREGHHLDRFCQDWAAWDDSYRFVVDKNEAFIKSCLPVETFKEDRLNVICFFNARGERVWSRLYDETWTPVEPEKAPEASFFAAMLHQTETKTAAKLPGILTTPWGIMLVAARPITTSNLKGIPRGTLVMGKFLSENLIETLRDQTCVNFRLRPIEEPRAVAQAMAGGEPVSFQERDVKILSVSSVIPDVFGTPVLLLQADIPRAITAMGRTTQNCGLISIVVVGAVLSLAMLISLQRIIIGPIGELTDRIIRIARSNNLSLRVPLQYTGEIDTLAREFNAMLQQLSHSRQKLLEQSYYAGLAEMASGTLRDIRDALNPLLVQVDRLRRQASEAGGAEEYKDRLDVMDAQVRQIRTILAEQERFRWAERPTETLPLDALLRESTDLVPDRLLQVMDVEIHFDPAQTPTVQGCRILLLQVVAGLFTNAAEAILRAGHERGRLQITVDSEWTGGREMVHLKFADNGDGIEPDRLTAIFERASLTQRPSRDLVRLGLHWCAEALVGMSGRIYAESDGKGRGACFHVLLPAGAPIPAAEECAPAT